jgi:uncharacterized protein HemY
VQKRSIFIPFLALAIGAFLLYKLPRYPKSADNIQAASAAESELDSLDVIVDKALQGIQSGQGNPMEYIMAIREVLAKNPDHLKANFTLGALSYSTGQYERAVERMKRVLEISPETEEAYKLLADSYSQLAFPDSAAQIAAKYLSKFPNGQFADELKVLTR